MKTKLAKLELILKYHRGECPSCQRGKTCGGYCIPAKLILDLIDEEKKMAKWRKLS